MTDDSEHKAPDQKPSRPEGIEKKSIDALSEAGPDEGTAIAGGGSTGSRGGSGGAHVNPGGGSTGSRGGSSGQELNPGGGSTGSGGG